MMEIIASDAAREFHLRTVQPGEALGSPFGGEPYPALVWATGRTTASQKGRLCAELIASGCRYAVFGGRECAAWEEAADEAFVAQDLSDEELAERHVTTTSHEREPADDVAFFFANNLMFGPGDFRRHLVLVIGDDPRPRAELVASLREETEGAG